MTPIAIEQAHEEGDPIHPDGIDSRGELSRNLSVSVVVPSYLRPRDLARCLKALAQQRLAATEVIVVVREGDSETLSVCHDAKYLPSLRVRTVARGGMVAALNAGVEAASGEIIAITDDDAAPTEDWLHRIASIFAADPYVGAVGGPDVVEGQTAQRARRGRVGRIGLSGRISGNHHAGREREYVHFLKGVNMAYRADALAGFDERLRGHGAQVGNDLQASLSVSRRGLRVVFDPQVRVLHYPGRRDHGDGRDERSLKMLRDQHHNETCILASTAPPLRAVAALVYAVLVGYRSAPGLGHLALRILSGPQRGRAVSESLAVAVGRCEGLVTALCTRPPRVATNR